MIAHILPRPLVGTLAAIPSKSEAHRVLICAALADKPTHIRLDQSSADIDATIDCLAALGTRFAFHHRAVTVYPIVRAPSVCDMNCRESGSTLRFLLPVAAALGVNARFHMQGKLPERPIGPLICALEQAGCTVTRPSRAYLSICGKLKPGSFEIPGDVSSQFISGLLFALPLLQAESDIRVLGKLTSAPYVHMTLRALRSFGIELRNTGDGYALEARPAYRSPGAASVGGDWSNAAFWICAGALPGCNVHVTGLDMLSAQGDRAILDLQAQLQCSKKSFVMDATHIPDLVPAMCAYACASGRALRIVNASRLREKESDRIEAIASVLRKLGGEVECLPDGLFMRAGCTLRGGDVSAFNDHRIAMMVAIAACACSEDVYLHGAESVTKSYPRFWDDYRALGGYIEFISEV